jgi:hypothetical protein
VAALAVRKHELVERRPAAREVELGELARDGLEQLRLAPALGRSRTPVAFVRSIRRAYASRARA